MRGGGACTYSSSIHIYRLLNHRLVGSYTISKAHALWPDGQRCDEIISEDDSGAESRAFHDNRVVSGFLVIMLIAPTGPIRLLPGRARMLMAQEPGQKHKQQQSR